MLLFNYVATIILIYGIIKGIYIIFLELGLKRKSRKK